MSTLDRTPSFDALPDGVLVHDPDTGEILTTNAACRDLLGVSGSTLAGRRVSSLAAGDWSDPPGESRGLRYAPGEGGHRVRRARRAGPVRFDWRVAVADRTVDLAVSLTVEHREWAGGEVAIATLRERPRGRERTVGAPIVAESDGLFVWELDLSAAVDRARRVADRTDRELATHLEANPEDHAEILEAMRVTDVNDRAVDFYGADSRGHLVENLEAVMTERSMETLRELWAALVDGETTHRAECVNRTFDGRRRDMLLEFVVSPTVEDCSRVYVTGMGITDRKDRERELRRKNELLDEFAAVVSHDVATPLGVVENKARLIEATGDPAHAADIYEATERVQSLVDDLRRLARRGERVGDADPVDLERVAREAWAAVDAPDATLVVRDSATVEADRGRLRQLLTNLLENAVEHGSTGSRTRSDDAVEHSSTGSQSETGDAVEHGSPQEVGGESGGGSRDGEEVPVVDGQGRSTDRSVVEVGTLPDGFYVADDGPGIPPEDHDRVFQRGVTTGGEGLGLAIVARVAAAHDWSVRATDADGDGGARIEVRTDD